MVPWSKGFIPLNFQIIICFLCSDSMPTKQASDSNLASCMVTLQEEVWQSREWKSPIPSALHFFITHCWYIGILVYNLALHVFCLHRMCRPDHPIPSAVAFSFSINIVAFWLQISIVQTLIIFEIKLECADKSSSIIRIWLGIVENSLR